MRRNIRLEAFYPFTPAQVWDVLTDRESLSEWLMATTDFEARVGCIFSFRAKPQPGWDGTVRCEVKEVSPPEKLVYTWKGGGNSIPVTLVTWTLVARPDGCLLVLEHNGFEGVFGVAVSFMLKSGWRKMLDKRLPARIRRKLATDHFERVTA